ncbi:hypothetical protein AB0D66_32475 [Streptomyces sp. NPDC048270]
MPAPAPSHLSAAEHARPSADGDLRFAVTLADGRVVDHHGTPLV